MLKTLFLNMIIINQVQRGFNIILIKYYESNQGLPLSHQF